MTDVFTPKKRSWIMSRIRSKNTKIDLKMKKILASLNCRYEMYPRVFGNPDFLVRDRQIAIFCDGDFWHGYNYEKKSKPRSKYWREKIERNKTRDRLVSRKLRRQGWSVLRFWEHDIDKNPDKCMRKLKWKIKKISQK